MLAKDRVGGECTVGPAALESSRAGAMEMVRHSTNSYVRKCVWGATQQLNFAYTVARH